MKRRLIPLLAVIGIVAFSVDANAAIISAVTGNSVKGGSGGQHFYKLGKGLSGNLNSVYVTINDSGSTGFLTNFELIQCDTASYNSPGFACGTTTYTALTTVGGTTYQSFALTGSSKRTVRLDFSIHSPAGGGAGTATPIALDPTKYYQVYFSGSSSATVDNANRAVEVYGIGTQLTDASGNDIQCTTTATGFTQCDSTLKTPYYILTDAALSSGDVALYGGISSSSFVPPWANPGPWNPQTGIASGSDYGLTSSASLTGADLGYFGNMMRDTALFLFSPWDESTANAWTNFRGALTVHVPFSYVAETITLVKTGTAASGSMPSWQFSNSTLGLASVSFFSSSTITQYAPTGFLATLRSLIEAGLWMGFLFFCYRTGMGIWQRI